MGTKECLMRNIRLLIVLYYYCSFSCFFREDFSFINGYELTNDILCISRSDDNRRAAEAVNSSAFGIHYNQTNLHLIDGPAARHSCPIVSISGSISIIWLRLVRSRYSVVSLSFAFFKLREAVFRTTIVHFLVFLKRFSPRHRASA